MSSIFGGLVVILLCFGNLQLSASQGSCGPKAHADTWVDPEHCDCRCDDGTIYCETNCNKDPPPDCNPCNAKDKPCGSKNHLETWVDPEKCECRCDNGRTSCQTDCNKNPPPDCNPCKAQDKPCGSKDHLETWVDPDHCDCRCDNAKIYCETDCSKDPPPDCKPCNAKDKPCQDFQGGPRSHLEKWVDPQHCDCECNNGYTSCETDCSKDPPPNCTPCNSRK